VRGRSEEIGDEVATAPSCLLHRNGRSVTMQSATHIVLRSSQAYQKVHAYVTASWRIRVENVRVIVQHQVKLHHLMLG
jgi:hypothetical protein